MFGGEGATAGSVIGKQQQQAAAGRGRCTGKGSTRAATAQGAGAAYQCAHARRQKEVVSKGLGRAKWRRRQQQSKQQVRRSAAGEAKQAEQCRGQLGWVQSERVHTTQPKTWAGIAT